MRRGVQSVSCARVRLTVADASATVTLRDLLASSDIPWDCVLEPQDSFEDLDVSKVLVSCVTYVSPEMFCSAP